ncbi:hypothetical protein [Azotobacter beijerinckii]|uniref:hypothetical protein n=1 Tax=Azotobacter beijerinckii TaxID=170623 RepID=UPI0011605BA4|nr:hypothetical protein [Azotobacter beijerinckii]
MDANINYAKYMLAWLDRIDPPQLPVMVEALVAIRKHWSGEEKIDLAKIKKTLWSWVDANGGPRIETEKNMLIARLILCVAYEDNRELEDMGFFEDLLNNYGASRTEINKYGPANPPSSP